MSVKMNDFLLQYYMQLRFNHMPAEVRAKFNEYAKNDDFRGHMKDWKKNLMTNGKSYFAHSKMRFAQWMQTRSHSKTTKTQMIF